MATWFAYGPFLQISSHQLLEIQYLTSFHSVYFLLKYEWLYLTSGRRYLFRFLSFLFIFTVWIFSTDSNISFIKLFLFNHVNLPIDLIEMPETWQIAIFQKMQKIPRSQNFWGGIHSTAANKSFPHKIGL